MAYQRGIGLHRQGRTADAEAAFASALQEDRRHVPARQALAVAFIGEGRHDEAETLLAAGLALSPHQFQLASTLARVKAERRDLAGAIEVLKPALAGGAGAVAPADHAQALALLGTLQQSAGQHADAIENYAQALRQSPGNGPWWIGLGLSLAADGRAESAREAFARARGTETLSPELLQYVDQRLRAGARPTASN